MGTAALPVTLSLLFHSGLLMALVFVSMPARPPDAQPQIILSEGESVIQISLVQPTVNIEPAVTIGPALPEPADAVEPYEEPWEPPPITFSDEPKLPEVEPPPEPRQEPAPPPPEPPQPDYTPKREVAVEQPEPVPPPKPSPAQRGVDRGASPVEQPSPEYPEFCRKRGQEGAVVLEVEVLTDGTVGQIRVVEECRYGRLTRAAIEAVRNTTFEPALRDGKPVASVVTIPFRFELHGSTK